MPWQNVVILSYFGKREEAYEILRSHLCWEEDPLGATDIIELYPITLVFCWSGRRRRLREKVLESLCLPFRTGIPQSKTGGLLP